MLTANPTFNDFNKTGSSPAARAQDSANNIAMLRTRYGTEIRFTNAQYGGAVLHVGPGQIEFRNLLVTGSNVHGGAAAGYIGGIVSSEGAMRIVGCSVWGSGGSGINVNSTHALLTNCFACSCGEAGFSTNLRGHLDLEQCGPYGNWTWT